MFRLLRYFSIASLLAFVAVALLLGLFYRSTAIQVLIEQEESKNVVVTQTFANSVRQELAAHLARAQGLAADELRALPSLAALRRKVDAARIGLPVAKVKIYNAAGVTVFSTETSQIGENKSANEGFLAARSGGVASELTHRNSFSSFDDVLENQDVLSTYVPVRLQGPDSEIAGVFELYSNVTALLRRISATERTLVAGAGTILLVLYVVLFLIVRRADGIIRRQEEERRQSEATLRRQQLALAASRERERLARNLHDSVGQVLGYVNAQAQAVAAMVAKGKTGEAHRLLQRLVEVAQQAQTEVRQQIHLLQAGADQDETFAAALAECVVRTKLRSNVQIEVMDAAVLEASGLPRAAETQILGIVQEALTNVSKHAQARHATVCFARNVDQLVVTVTDDGAGFAPDSLAQQAGWHFGLRMMADRAAEIGGVLRVQSAPGRGTQVDVSIPLPQLQPQKEYRT